MHIKFDDLATMTAMGVTLTITTLEHSSLAGIGAGLGTTGAIYIFRELSNKLTNRIIEARRPETSVKLESNHFDR